MNIKYTKESIQDRIIGSTSIMQAFVKLGLSYSGSNNRLRGLIKEVLIEQGTYKGKLWNKGLNTPVLKDDEYFTNKGIKRTTYSVRNALFKRGLKEKRCEHCKQTDWCGKPIPLEVHHVDGNKYNNLIDNLEILCPNCHYFTDTYKTKNRS